MVNHYNMKKSHTRTAASAKLIFTINVVVCCLFNNIEFMANPPLYTIVQYIKTSVDSTMLKIRNEKKKIFIKCMIQKKKQKKNFFKSLEYSGSCRSTTLRSDHANSTNIV
jgi:hypothetical protein